eukprot:TRINITY_DN2650_c0_g1_i2.p1 TRINITY_DN2650_c0_g1~~TRINITY_DN2650_c0_g1_i2.p1  ORF type:complete len:169 (-),score=8.92 TRINITY_DN2650_c0_g1_i2:174-680(-)
MLERSGFVRMNIVQCMNIDVDPLHLVLVGLVCVAAVVSFEQDAFEQLLDRFHHHGLSLSTHLARAHQFGFVSSESREGFLCGDVPVISIRQSQNHGVSEGRGSFDIVFRLNKELARENHHRAPSPKADRPDFEWNRALLLPLLLDRQHLRCVEAVPPVGLKEVPRTLR